MADRYIFRHIRADDDRVRTEGFSFEHRHRRAYPVAPRDIAAGRDHSADAATDNYRLVIEARVIALLDRGIKGVALNMGDIEMK